MSTPFYKLQGTGNDFIFFLAEEGLPQLDRKAIAALCARQTGIGADGLVVVRRQSGGELTHQWDFYNADGGEAEMCGNAARCATRLLTQKESLKEIKLQTRAGVFTGTVAGDGEVEVSFATPTAETRKIENIFNGRFPVAYLTNTGVPHCVVPVSTPWELRNEARALAPFIFDAAFSSAGANLTFVDWSGGDHFETVTLERGVNDFTLACGTGVIAAAKVYADLNGKGGWRQLSTPGGALSVHYTPGSAQVRLKGPAKIIFKGEL